MYTPRHVQHAGRQYHFELAPDVNGPTWICSLGELRIGRLPAIRGESRRAFDERAKHFLQTRATARAE